MGAVRGVGDASSRRSPRSWGLRTGGVGRAARFAVAAGVANAFMAVLTKAFADKLGDGIGETFSSWEPYAVIAAGILSMLLIQTAYQAGHPTVVLPDHQRGRPARELVDRRHTVR